MGLEIAPPADFSAKTLHFFPYEEGKVRHAASQALERRVGGGAIDPASITDPARRGYLSLLIGLDDAVGRVTAHLQETGAAKNTLIFFFSDNGGPTASTTSGNGPLRGFKSQTWEGGIRVPFLVQWKGRIPAGKVDDRPVIQLDIHPTALAAAGVAIKPEWKLDGVNLRPYLTGEKSGVPHEALYWRFGKL